MATTDTDTAWTIEITPKRRWYDIDFRELWRYRDLFRMYVRRDIVVVYKQTVLGPLWYLIQPILTTIMFMFVFGGLAGISTDGVPQALFYLSGLLLWNYFSSVFTETSGVFIANANIFGKVYFPRLVMPLAIATSNLVKLLIQALLFAVVYVFIVCTSDATVHLNAYALLAPVLVLMTALLSLSWGMIISSLTTKYRDLTKLIAFGVQLYMYATPIIYPLSVAPEKYRDIIALNPLTPIFEAFRAGLLSSGDVSWGGLGYSLGWIVFSLFLAVVVFSKVERTFIDTV